MLRQFRNHRRFFDEGAGGRRGSGVGVGCPNVRRFVLGCIGRCLQLKAHRAHHAGFFKIYEIDTHLHRSIISRFVAGIAGNPRLLPEVRVFCRNFQKFCELRPIDGKERLGRSVA